MSKIVVLQDLDGCLFDFEKGYYERFGEEFNDASESQKTKWENIDATPDFFSYLPLIPGAKEMVATISEFCIANDIEYRVLSSTGKNHLRVVGQKNCALEREFPEFLESAIYVIDGLDKANYARPNRLLIDDRLKVIMAFNQAGGETVMFTNAAATANTVINVLKRMLREEEENAEKV